MSKCQQIAVIDCQVAGVSGDMFLGALLDLGANAARVVDAIESLENYIEECKNLEVNIKDVARKGICAKKIDVKAETTLEMSGARLIEVVGQCVDDLKLSEKAKRFALNSIKTLVSVEAKIHGEEADKVHLHEAGLIDTPADIIGITVALENLGLFNSKVYSTPVAVGGGLFKFSHGTVSSPAPATVEILRSKGFPMVGGPVKSELATPTGVSILVNLADEITSFYPSMKPISVGYGAGTKDFTEMPNILRIVLGEPFSYYLLRDEVLILETNLDDVTGEVIGYVLDKLLREGAKDVSVIPMFTKKNRPGQILKVITDKKNVERLSRVLIEETGSLGVRMYTCERRILSRDSVSIDVVIDNSKESVKVKIAKDGKGKILQIKPEYEDIKRVADKTNKPLREVMKMIERKAEEILLREGSL